MFYLPRKSYSIPLNSKIETLYFDNIPIDENNDSSYKKLITTTNYSYNNTSHYQLTSQKTILPEQNTMEINYSYAHEKNNQKLINANIIGIPLQTITKKDNVIVSNTETKYDNPLNLLPSSVVSTDLQNVVSTEVTYDKYDSKGNLQQYITKDGLSTVIIWGYNQTQPIAKIEGAKLADIQQSFIDSIVTASNTDASAGVNNDETAFLSALNTFRSNTALSGYQITTYTYDPLVGVRSITPPSGITESYSYDSANRLEKVIDVNGKVLKEMKYNYKN
ncbi:RHS repeat protein [Chryseobacterium sp. 1B4]